MSMFSSVILRVIQHIIILARLTWFCPATGPIPVSAPAQVLQDELNALWSIKPDTVIVTMQQLDEQSEYTITFNSTRGKKLKITMGLFISLFMYA